MICFVFCRVWFFCYVFILRNPLPPPFSYAHAHLWKWYRISLVRLRLKLDDPVQSRSFYCGSVKKPSVCFLVTAVMPFCIRSCWGINFDIYIYILLYTTLYFSISSKWQLQYLVLFVVGAAPSTHHAHLNVKQDSREFFFSPFLEFVRDSCKTKTFMSRTLQMLLWFPLDILLNVLDDVYFVFISFVGGLPHKNRCFSCSKTSSIQNQHCYLDSPYWVDVCCVCFLQVHSET